MSPDPSSQQLGFGWRVNLLLVTILVAMGGIGEWMIQKFGHSVVSSSDFGLEFRRARVRGMVDAIPSMIRESPNARLVFVVGTSEIESGFDTHEFDRQYHLRTGQASVSWNLGIRGRGREVDAMQSTVIRRVFQERRPGLIFNQISLSRTTTRQVENDLERDISEDFSIFFDRSFQHKNGFQSISSPGLSTDLQILLMDWIGVDTTYSVNRFAARSAVFELFAPPSSMGEVFPWRDLRLHTRPAFEASHRGSFNWSLPDSVEAFQQHIRNRDSVFARRWMRSFFWNCCFRGVSEIDLGSVMFQVDKARLWSKEMQVPVVHVLLPILDQGFESLPVKPLNEKLKSMWKPEWGELLDLTEDVELRQRQHFLDLVHFLPSGRSILARRLAERAQLINGETSR